MIFPTTTYRVDGINVYKVDTYPNGTVVETWNDNTFHTDLKVSVDKGVASIVVTYYDWQNNVITDPRSLDVYTDGVADSITLVNGTATFTKSLAAGDHTIETRETNIRNDSLQVTV